MKNDLVALASTHRMYEGIARTSHVFNEILDRMYSSHKIDSTFSALGKAVGDDYNVSDRAFGMRAKQAISFEFFISLLQFYFPIRMQRLSTTFIAS